MTANLNESNNVMNKVQKSDEEKNSQELDGDKKTGHKEGMHGKDGDFWSSASPSQGQHPNSHQQTNTHQHLSQQYFAHRPSLQEQSTLGNPSYNPAVENPPQTLPSNNSNKDSASSSSSTTNNVTLEPKK